MRLVPRWGSGAWLWRGTAPHGCRGTESEQPPTGLDRDPPVFAALALHLQDRAVLGGKNVADIGTEELVGAEPGQHSGQDACAIAFHLVAAALVRFGAEGLEQRHNCVVGVPFRKKLLNIRPELTVGSN
jgi:hypothetical protein